MGDEFHQSEYNSILTFRNYKKVATLNTQKHHSTFQSSITVPCEITGNQNRKKTDI